MGVKDTFNSTVARKTHLVWNPKKPNEPVLWESTVELGHDFFHDILRHPFPLDMNILKALKKSPLGLDFYMWAVYRTFSLTLPLRLSWPALYRQFGADPSRANDKLVVNDFRKDCVRGKARWNPDDLLPSRRTGGNLHADSLCEGRPGRPDASRQENHVAAGGRDQERGDKPMTTERTQVGQEVEEALGEVLAHVRGEVALPCRIVDDPAAEHILALRKRMKLSRQKFADRFGLDARAVQDWEQGRRVPDRAARVLLTVIDRDPEAVVRVLSE